ncbi:YidC/Oxa1 family membrane protein insertase, partial [Candidatus Roizmanbacteria bacterium]|nr:YidC/Oxa1 family membrane protein insertase [Candidatus Roizmanbacteria bacterium]
MLSPNIFNVIFVFPIVNLLVAFYNVFLFLHIPGALGFAIILLTVLVRALLHPFFKQQLETSKKMQDIKPHIDKLQKKHKDDPKKLQQEQMRIYKEAGINPAAGCLFMIIQLPIFFALYNTLNLFLTSNTTQVINSVNKILYMSALKIHTIDPWFFGINLALSPAKTNNLFYLIIPVVTGLLQYFQVKYSTPGMTSTPTKEGEKDSTGDFQKAMNTQMKFIFPLMIGWFSYTLPVGLSLYWNIFSIFSIIQYRSMINK